jgi:Uma2 family endonuclease
MASTARQVHYPYSEYLVLEDQSPVRHEYLDGEIYAMAGGSPEHAALAAAVLRSVGNQLPPLCRTFTADLRIRIAASGLTTYPDGAVICGPIVRALDDHLAVVNPILLVEVTSPSTEDYDRGEKLRHYKLLPGLREVLVVSHREPRLTLHRREGDLWTVTAAAAGETLALAAVPARIVVDDLYRVALADLG